MLPFDSLPDNTDDDADLAPLPARLQRPRRREALAAPPPDYFDELPTRVLARINTLERERAAAAASPRLNWSWPRLKLALASASLGGAFVMALWIGHGMVSSSTANRTLSADAALTSVSHAELVAYLTDPTGGRLSATDLSQVADLNFDPASTGLFDGSTTTDLTPEALDELLPTDGPLADDLYL